MWNKNEVTVKPKVKCWQAALVVPHKVFPCCSLQVLVLGCVAVGSWGVVGGL